MLKIPTSRMGSVIPPKNPTPQMTQICNQRDNFLEVDDVYFPEKRTFLRQRVEARLASLLMESKEYSEALSVLSGLIKESIVRVSHRLPLVFFVVLELKHRSSSYCFHCTQKVSFHFHYFGYCFACSYVFCLKNLFTFFLAKIILLLSKFDKIYRQRGKVSNFEDNYLN
ncbi:hypothetical protein PRUPE_8G029500 [Prunus persica]|uniref:Uncharacterized protein n=1 Tax=Prunus persica TaxID=3760 RepID=M5VLP7_PRUPE|nr:hypothetical protein PRUPE_8G029500 [Prunus persica]